MLGSIGERQSRRGARERTGKAPCPHALGWGWRGVPSWQLCLCRREWRSSGAGPERARGVGRAEHSSRSVPAHAGRCEGKTTDVKDTGWGPAAALHGQSRSGSTRWFLLPPTRNYLAVEVEHGENPFFGQCFVTLVVDHMPKSYRQAQKKTGISRLPAPRGTAPRMLMLSTQLS